MAKDEQADENWGALQFRMLSTLASGLAWTGLVGVGIAWAGVVIGAPLWMVLAGGGVVAGFVGGFWIIGGGVLVSVYRLQSSMWRAPSLRRGIVMAVPTVIGVAAWVRAAPGVSHGSPATTPECATALNDHGVVTCVSAAQYLEVLLSLQALGFGAAAAGFAMLSFWAWLISAGLGGERAAVGTVRR